MENTETTVLPEGTIPAEDTHAEETVQTQPEGAPQSGADSDSTAKSENTERSGGLSEPEFVLPVDFNHESRNLTRDEAIRYAQIGMKFDTSGIDLDSIKPLYNKLDYIAAQRDCSIEEVVNGLLDSDEATYRKELESKLNGADGVIDDLMRVYREKQKEKYDRVLSDRKEAEERSRKEAQTTLESRLAGEFAELKTEFPDIGEFSQLPEEVKAEAARGRDLLSAYLRYSHAKQKEIAAAQKSEEEAARASTGTGSSAGSNSETPEEAAFMAGLWGR